MADPRLVWRRDYCPVAKATEILGDRWTLLIVREMLGGASGFNELQRGLPGISRSSNPRLHVGGLLLAWALIIAEYGLELERGVPAL